ncbi:hypothetical protein MRY82_05140 [bacterium]|nr:hypothetical protein [bacterium]
MLKKTLLAFTLFNMLLPFYVHAQVNETNYILSLKQAPYSDEFINAGLASYTFMLNQLDDLSTCQDAIQKVSRSFFEKHTFKSIFLPTAFIFALSFKIPSIEDGYNTPRDSTDKTIGYSLGAVITGSAIILDKKSKRKYQEQTLIQLNKLNNFIENQNNLFINEASIMDKIDMLYNWAYENDTDPVSTTSLLLSLRCSNEEDKISREKLKAFKQHLRKTH